MAAQGRALEEHEQQRIVKLVRDMPGRSGRGNLSGSKNAARIVGCDVKTARKYLRKLRALIEKVIPKKS